MLGAALLALEIVADALVCVLDHKVVRMWTHPWRPFMCPSRAHGHFTVHFDRRELIEIGTTLSRGCCLRGMHLSHDHPHRQVLSAQFLVSLNSFSLLVLAVLLNLLQEAPVALELLAGRLDLAIRGA